jgi:pimeloyl-ACP methyl ester carboxylesterase
MSVPVCSVGRVTDTTLTPTRSRVEVAPGVGLRVRAWPAAGRPFLLVHGLASNARLWDGVAARLALAGHAAYAVDLRGHGESDRPEDGYDTRTAAVDVLAVADRLGLEHPVLAGQSWGGNVVLDLAARWPERPAAVALVDGGWLHLADAYPTFEECWAVLAPPRLSPVPLATIRERLRSFHPDWPDSGIEGTLGNFAEQPDGTARIRLTRERHRSILRSLWEHRPRELYRLVHVPALLLPAGRLDATGRRLGTERVAEALAALPDGAVSWYDGGHHDLHAQQPERVAVDLAALARRAVP